MSVGVLRSAVFAAVCVVASTVAQASPLYASFDNFTYSGTVTRYGTLADALGGTNGIGTYTIPTSTVGDQSTRPNAHDGQIYFANEALGLYDSDLIYASTAWYYTLTPALGDGYGNPSNENTGFFQYYTSANQSVTGGWSPGNTQFNVSITGGDGDDFNSARLWAAPANGASNEQRGAFLQFDLNATATFGSAAVLSGTTGWYETSAMPSSFSGNIAGIFQNDNTSVPSLNGFYGFKFEMNGPGSWAADQGATYDGNGPSSFWAAPSIASSVPEPSTLALFMLALVGLGLTHRRQRN